MRQAIKGDGSDGTAALKAYLLAHDEVMAQELYEFTQPGIGGGLGISTAFSLSAKGVFVEDPGFAGFGAATVSDSAGEIDRWESRPLGGGDDPGQLFFSYDPPGLYAAPGFDSGGARPRSEIQKVVAVMEAYYTPGVDSSYTPPLQFAPIYYLNVSLDGGATFPLWLNPAIDPILTSAKEFTADISSLIGDIETFDFSQVQFRVRDQSSIFVDCDEHPGAQLFILKVGLRFSYGGLPAGIVAPEPLAKVCDASSALTYAGDVYAPANIKNNGFKSKIGLDVDSLQLDWNFRGDEPMVIDPDTDETILTMLQGFQWGLWKGVWVKWRRVYMPTFGDCDTLGAVSMFRGRIADVEIDRLTAKITVNSVTEMFNRQVPQQLIEANNRSLQVGPGLPPDLDPDPTHWTVFQCVTGHGGTLQKIVARQTAPTADQVYAPGTYDLGYLFFQASPLKSFVAQVQRYEVIAGYNVFYLFRPLYVDPHGYGGLSFTAFVPVPKDQTLSGAGGVELPGFPRVPLP